MCLWYTHHGFLLSQGWEPAGHCEQRQSSWVPRQSASGVRFCGIVLVRRSTGGQPGFREPATTTHQPQPHQSVHQHEGVISTVATAANNNTRIHSDATNTLSLSPLLLLADSFETILKSLLSYQSGMGGGANETVIRKKVYENAINNTLKNNFPVMLKVCSTDEKAKREYCRLNVIQALTNKPFAIVICYQGGGGTGRQVEVVPRSSAHPTVRPPAGFGHEDCHPAGSGGAVRRRRCCHFFPEEPWRGEKLDTLNITHLIIKSHSVCGGSVLLVEKSSGLQHKPLSIYMCWILAFTLLIWVPKFSVLHLLQFISSCIFVCKDCRNTSHSDFNGNKPDV